MTGLDAVVCSGYPLGLARAVIEEVFLSFVVSASLLPARCIAVRGCVQGGRTVEILRGRMVVTSAIENIHRSHLQQSVLSTRSSTQQMSSFC